MSLSLQVAGLNVPCEGTLGCVASVVLGETKLGSLASWSAWFHRGCMKGDLAPGGIPKPRIPRRTVTVHLLLLVPGALTSSGQPLSTSFVPSDDSIASTCFSVAVGGATTRLIPSPLSYPGCRESSREMPAAALPDLALRRLPSAHVPPLAGRSVKAAAVGSGLEVPVHRLWGRPVTGTELGRLRGSMSLEATLGLHVWHLAWSWAAAAGGSPACLRSHTPRCRVEIPSRKGPVCRADGQPTEP